MAGRILHEMAKLLGLEGAGELGVVSSELEAKFGQAWAQDDKAALLVLCIWAGREVVRLRGVVNLYEAQAQASSVPPRVVYGCRECGAPVPAEGETCESACVTRNANRNRTARPTDKSTDGTNTDCYAAHCPRCLRAYWTDSNGQPETCSLCSPLPGLP